MRAIKATKTIEGMIELAALAVVATGETPDVPLAVVGGPWVVTRAVVIRAAMPVVCRTPVVGVGGITPVVGVAGRIPVVGVAGTIPVVGVAGRIPVVGVAGTIPVVGVVGIDPVVARTVAFVLITRAQDWS